MVKKKAKYLGPRRKRMKRPARLQFASSWIHTYKGKNLVRGYMKWYAVDEICALTELQLLGVDISDSRLKQLKKNAKNKAFHRKKRKENKITEDRKSLYEDSDDTFCFIAGYTACGFPYGVTWEEIGKIPPWLNEENVGTEILF